MTTATTQERWVKYVDDAGQVVYRFTMWPLGAEDRDGADVYDHYHRETVVTAEQTGRKLPPITVRDQSYPAAYAAFA